MMLGKRGRPPFRRTTSMTGMTAALPRAQKAATGGEFDAYDPTDIDIETSDFLRSCGLCNRRLAPGRDIYMYRGDAAFCSLECRERQMKQDERKERCAAAAAKIRESLREKPEAAASGTSGKNQSLAAA